MERVVSYHGKESLETRNENSLDTTLPSGSQSTGLGCATEVMDEYTLQSVQVTREVQSERNNRSTSLFM